MYVRVVDVRAGADGIARLEAAFAEHVVAAARTQPGYLGAALILRRHTGEATSVTRWGSLDALNATEQLTVETRRQLTATRIADVLDVDRYELVIQEAHGEVRVPAYIRGNELYTRPDGIDALVAFVRERVPAITRRRGCRSLLMGVNRMTGRCFVSSVWATAEDRQAGEAAFDGIREQSGAPTGTEPTVSLGEVVFVELERPVEPD